MLALIYGVVAHLLSMLHQLQAELQKRFDRRTASLAAGAFGYVLKPFSGPALKAAIETALHKYQIEIESRRASNRAA